MYFKTYITILSAAFFITACQDDNNPQQDQGTVVTGGRPTILNLNGERLLESVSVELIKTPTGYIEVGKSFSVAIRVFHQTENPGVSTVFGTNAWGLRYGQLFQVMGTNHAVTPTFVNDSPRGVSIATGRAWQGRVNFRCQNPGMTLLRYQGQVSWPVSNQHAQGIGIDQTISGDLTAYCIAAGSGGGGTNVTPTPAAVRIGPFTGYGDNTETYGNFVVRLWRLPAGDDVPVGQTVQTHVEVENYRINSSNAVTASTPRWALAGRLYQQFGSALAPRRYTDAPVYRENVAALGTWSHDYDFTCHEPGVAQLRYDANLYTDLSQPLRTSTISGEAESIRCVTIEKVQDEKSNGEGNGEQEGD